MKKENIKGFMLIKPRQMNTEGAVCDMLINLYNEINKKGKPKPRRRKIK